MKRLLRCAFNFATAASAVLFVATCVLWVRSYWWIDVAAVNVGDVRRDSILGTMWPRSTVLSGGTGASFEADSGCGEFALSRLRFHNSVSAFVSVTSMTVTNRPGSYPVTSPADARAFIGRRDGVHILGWTFWRDDGATHEIDYVVIPCWAAALAAALFPVWAALRRARSRPRPGFCRACGYDLRASLHRCPECGAVPAGKAAS